METLKKHPVENLDISTTLSIPLFILCHKVFSYFHHLWFSN
jgi:hypothetical protein